MTDEIPENLGFSGPILYEAGCRCGRTKEARAVSDVTSGTPSVGFKREISCHGCGLKVTVEKTPGRAANDAMKMARAAVPEGAVVTHAEFVRQETPQPIWTKRNLEEWAKAVLGESAIVFQNGQQICAEAATPGPLGYQVKRFYLQLEGDALVWKDQSKTVYREIDLRALSQQFTGQQMGGGANGR